MIRTFNTLDDEVSSSLGVVTPHGDAVVVPQESGNTRYSMGGVTLLQSTRIRRPTPQHAATSPQG